MAGGLLQLASEGIEDVYLTNNPEITYFSKIYRRHTNFSSEFKYLPIEQSFSFNDTISITIDKLGDLVGKSFIEVEIPSLHLSDSLIKDPEFNIIKKNKLTNLKNELNQANITYNNYKSFYESEIKFYRYIKQILKTENLENSVLKIEISNYIEKLDNRKKLILALDNSIVLNVDLFRLIIDELNKETNLDNIINLIDNQVINLNKYLKKYFYIIKDKQDDYNNILKGVIDYCWDKYLGLNLFESYEIEIDGFVIERYNKDTLFIHLKNNYPTEILKYLDTMIGNIKKLNSFNSNKPKTKLYIPLIFWFCKESPNYLPLVSLRYTDIVLKLKFNKLENILFFQDIEKRFTQLKKFTVYDNINLTQISNNNTIININYNNEKDNYQLEMKNITKTTIKYIFPEISNIDLNKIFEYSSDNNTINLTDFGRIRREMSDKSLLFKLFGKEIFFEYNVMYSILKYLKINLMVEYIYLDEVEREKFALNKLEYLIDVYNDNIFNIGKQTLFNNELDFTNPTKFMYFYFNPKGTNYGLHQYDIKKNNNYKIDYKGILDFNIIINGFKMFSTNPINDLYYKDVSTYQYFINELPEGIHLKSFCLYPSKSQPSGSVNFSYLKGKIIKLAFSDEFIEDYYNINKNINQDNLYLNFVIKKYNILSIHKGKCRILFTN